MRQALNAGTRLFVRPPMGRARGWVCAFGLLLAGCRGASSPVDVASPAGAAIATNRFGFDLYEELRAAPGNLIFSPASAEVALAMTSAGARGDTLNEMAQVLHVKGLDDAHLSFGSLLATLNGRDGSDGVTIHVANRLWGQSGLPFRPEFLAAMTDHYSAPLGAVDYENAREAARAAINAWAAQETHDRIREIISPGMLNEDTRIVLADAVYFKGAWKSPFDSHATADEDFTTPSAKVKVSMMRDGRWMKYAQVRGAQLVELPYRGGFTMVVVLPDAADALSAVEGRIRDEYDSWIASLRPRAVDLKLPRWKTTSFFDLQPSLKAMGMRRAFGDADFSGMCDLALHVDFVVQKSFVESNEGGTEAAAVTAVGGAGGSGEEWPPPPPPAVFHADHSFLYFIRDAATGVVLFVGRENDPRG